MKFEIEIIDRDLAAIEHHMMIRGAFISTGCDSVTLPDRICALVLGAAKTAGYGKRRKGK